MSQGYTTTRYGNVTIYRCTTQRYIQEPVFDTSGTDLLYQKHTITVTGFLSGNQAGTIGSSGATFQYNLTSDGTGVNPQGLANVRHLQIRRQLPPRQPFSITVGDPVGDGTGGFVWLSALPAPTNMIPNVTGQISFSGNLSLSNLDLNNGPICTSFVVTRVTGNEMFEVEATFEICKIECDINGNVPNNNSGILNNRWSCNDSYDALLRTTRTYAGELVLASNNLIAQQYRWIVVPPLMPMFRRDGMSFFVSEDGLHLSWTCTDTEIAQAAPYPARRWEVSHKLYGNNGIMGVSSVRVQLWGDSNVNKADLIEAGLYAVTSKMFGYTPPQINDPAFAPPDSPGFWSQFLVEDFELEDSSVDENSIIISMRVRKTLGGNQAILATVADVAQKFGVPFKPADFTTSAYTRDNRLAYDRSLSWGAFPGDKTPYQSPAASIVGIFATYLQTPCNDLHATFLQGQGAGSSIDNRSASDLNGLPYTPNAIPYTATIRASNAPVIIQNPYASASHKKNAYVLWQTDNIYRTRTTRVQMPISRSNLSAPGPNTIVNPGYSPSSAIVKLAGFQTVRRVRVKAMRIGAEPEFPSPDDASSFPDFPGPPGTTGGSGTPTALTQTFLRQKIRIGTPTLSPFGQKLYRAEAEYVFGLSRAPNPGEQLAIGNDMDKVFGPQNTDSSGTISNSSWLTAPAP